METRTNIFPDLVVVAHQKGKESTPESGLKRRVLAYNDKLFLAEHEMVKGWVGTVHDHPHDQIVYVVHGHIRVTCQGNTFDARTGDTFVVRGGVQHGASAIEDSRVVDVFTPCRRSEEHTSELQSQSNLVCRLLLEKKKKKIYPVFQIKNTKKDEYNKMQ